MDQSDKAVDGGGGAMFHGDIIAGRDVTINHFTEIRQVTEHLYNRCGAAEGVSENLLGRLDVLNGTAEFVEEYAKELQASVPPNDPQLQKIFRECASILSELRRLVALIEDSRCSDDADTTGFSTISLNEDVMDIRFRLMSLQFNLSRVHNKKIEQDADIIKKKVTELMNGPANADDTSSIRTFYTASSVPYVERQTWRELERALSASLTAKFVRDNYSLIVAIVEETVWENITPRPIDTIAPAPTATMASTLTNSTTPTLQGSDQSSTLPGDTDEGAQGTTIAERHSESAQTALRQTLEEMKLEFPALLKRPLSITAINYDGPSADRSGRTWASCDDDSGGERLLTFDGGGVKSYSSVLIMEELMKEIALYENMFEKGFTNYPRNFDAAELRPCHYFDKMYGTSTGGIIAIALSRLRMTVPETMRAFREILTAMYTNPRTSIPLATKYSHSAFQEALNSMVNVNCKEHPTFLCGRDDKFPWRSAEEQDTNALCQTICLTAINTSQLDEGYLLRTYDHRYDPDIAPVWVIRYNEGVDDLTIQQAARATTAAPFYFKMVEAFVGNPPVLVEFKDGGVTENNPSYCAYSEHSSLHGDDVQPSVLVSIGASRPDNTLGAFRSVWPGPLGSSPLTQKYTEKFAVFKKVLIKEAEGQDQHKLMRTIARGEHHWYKRFSVTTGLGTLRLDQWESGWVYVPEHKGKTKQHRGEKTIHRIQIATQAYLDRDADRMEYAPPREMLKQTAERLVRLRRAREFEAMTEGGEKREKWETYIGKHLAGEREFFQEYLAQWDYAMLGQKGSSTQNLSRD